METVKFVRVFITINGNYPTRSELRLTKNDGKARTLLNAGAIKKSGVD